MVLPNWVGVNNQTLPESADDHRKPLARYSATNGALASGFTTAELHHLWGHDLAAGQPQAIGQAMRYDQSALRMALTTGFSVVFLSCASAQILDPRSDPINLLKELEACKTDALISGQQTAQVLLGNLIKPYNFEIGRARVSGDVAVDYCVLSTRYTETFHPGGSPEDWEIAGPEIQKMIADFEKLYNSTRFKLLDQDAVAYSTGKSQTVISLFHGRSEREIDFRIGFASNPFRIHDFDEKSQCKIDGLATIGFGKRLYAGMTPAEPGSISEAVCAKDPQRCQSVLVPLLQRGKTYKDMLFVGGKGYMGEMKAKFLDPLSYELKAADGIFVLNEQWGSVKLQWLGDSSARSLSLFDNGKRVAVGECTFGQ
ncbi:hypothetical protein ACVDG8_021690 [Mesorhizobium sp. ORM8.1]